jgi:hypothetical protein
MIPCLIHRGYVYKLNSRIVKFYCKYSYSLPAAKPAVYTQMCAPLSPLNIPPLLYFQSLSSPVFCRIVTLSHFPARRHVPVLMLSPCVAEPLTCSHFCEPVRGLDFVLCPTFSLLACIIHHLFFQFLLPPPLPDTT